MKQLSDTENQELAAKIKDEQKRQQTLREMYPNTPEDSKETSAGTGFTSSYLWKYGFLAIILCLLAYSLFIQFKWWDFSSDKFTGTVLAFDAIFQPYCLLSHDKRVEKRCDENGRMGLDSIGIRLLLLGIGVGYLY